MDGTKKSSTFNKVVNIIVIVVVALVALIAISRVTSFKKGYNSIFGTAIVAVESDSMKGEGKDNFKRGDLLFIKVLKDTEKGSLKGNQIAMFKYYDENVGAKIIVTHRVEALDGVGRYITHGDNNPETSKEYIYADEVIGVYKSQIKGIGHLVLFFSSQWGFFSIVVIPCLLVVLYCVYRVIVSVKAYNKEKAGIAAENAMTEEDKIAALEAQLQALKNQSPQEPGAPDDKS